MRNELLAWFAREGMLLSQVSMATDDPDDEIKIIYKAPLVALSRASSDFRECPDPVLFGYPESSLDMMTIDDFHQFVLTWFEKAVEANMAHCFVCNKQLDNGTEKPWDAVFVSDPLYCWLLIHFDCKRYLSRDLKGRNPFEVTTQSPELFDMHL